MISKKYESLIIKRFNNKFNKFGVNIKSIGWDNKEIKKQDLKIFLKLLT